MQDRDPTAPLIQNGDRLQKTCGRPDLALVRQGLPGHVTWYRAGEQIGVLCGANEISGVWTSKQELVSASTSTDHGLLALHTPPYKDISVPARFTAPNSVILNSLEEE